MKEIKKNFYFSIIIPTYNREKYLVSALMCLLNQTFVDFEIIVIDSFPKQTTCLLIKNFNDSRIKYMKLNNKELWIDKINKGIVNAKGKYIILHGDDDFLFKKNALKNLYLILKKKKYGYVRLNYLSYIEEYKKIFNFNNDKHFKKSISIKKNKKNEDIINFIIKSEPFFLTGIVFKNNFTKKIKIINSELAPWFNIIYFNTLHYGACYLNLVFFICRWPIIEKKEHPFFYLLKGKFSFENYYQAIFKCVNREYYKNFLKKHLNEVVKSFPANKAYSNNRNLIKISNRVLALDPSYKYLPIFWVYLLGSLLIPGCFLNYLRKKTIKDIANKYNQLNFSYEKIFKRN